jgi:hypothetical protein
VSSSQLDATKKDRLGVADADDADDADDRDAETNPTGSRGPEVRTALSCS